jgi:hypothetical protein
MNKGKSIRKNIEDVDDYIGELGSRKEILNVLRSSGKSRGPSDFPILEIYLAETGKHPFIKNYGDLSLNHVELVDELRKSGVEEIFTRETANDSADGEISLVTESAFYKIQKGYYIEITVGYFDANSYSQDMQRRLKNLSNKENLVLISSLVLLCPGERSPLHSAEVEKNIHELVKKHFLRRSTDNAYIGMICKENNFYIKDFYITKDYTIKQADLHYGEGFDTFHAQLLERFKNDPKGLVLFHGDPGTGKTYYIRNLIKDLIKLGKQVIYFPPNMVGHLVSPEIMTFLASTVMELAEEGKSCVLLLEDAEPLLVSRGNSGRSDGITNLLNITDGLLNDMLSIQVIATFNTDLKNIDGALLRPERLIARKEFKRLNAQDANKLAKAINLDKTFTEDTSLAEIYSQQKAKEVLIHTYEDNKTRKLGF